jgi:SAM-dependent methyltransferase
VSAEGSRPEATSFGEVAETYARARPSYPDDAVDWLVEGAHAVVDLGAGTGALTRSLLARGLDVTAVEPSDGMRSQLTHDLPDVRVVEGFAESLPLPDASFDAVVVAQAWHWVDATRAVPEVARVLRPGGLLSLVWNIRDESIPWVAELSAVFERHGRDRPDNSGSRRSLENFGPESPFGPLETFETHWLQPMTPERLGGLIASRSAAITMKQPARDALLDEVALLTRTHPDLRGRSSWDLPYVTLAWRARKLS